MPPQRFTSQAQIYEICAKMAENAEFWIRQAILKNDDRLLVNAQLALHFPFKHGNLKHLGATEWLFKAFIDIADYLGQRDFSKLERAMRSLRLAREHFLGLAQLAREQGWKPTAGDIVAWPKDSFIRYDVLAQDLQYAAWMAYWIIFFLYPLARAPFAIRAILLRRLAIREAEKLLAKYGPVIRREVPHLWKQIQALVNEIKGIKPPP
jgi:hypothetical protein